MIRESAARKLAHDLLDIYIANNLCSQAALESAVRLIMGAVELDETQQSIERKQSVLKAIGGTH
jgi:hypothetical protein